jgi:hypothetical protein
MDEISERGLNGSNSCYFPNGMFLGTRMDLNTVNSFTFRQLRKISLSPLSLK